MGPRGFVVRLFGGMLVGIAAAACVLALAGPRDTPASGGAVLAAGQPSGRWASAAELTWLRKVGAWNATLMRGLVTATNSRALQQVVDGTLPRGRSAVTFIGSLAPARSCGANLRAQVGAPPTRRLAVAWNALQRACTQLQLFAAGLTQAVKQRKSYAVPPAEYAAQRGAALLSRANRLLPPGETRALPVIGGFSKASRVEPRFSRIASALAHHRVEARCWSEDDWVRLMREESALTMNHVDGALGFATLNGTRDNLSPLTCATLVRLAYGHWYPTASDQQLTVAQAVVTLSHEPQHSRGVAVEAQAECYAIQLMKGTAIKLGAPRPYAGGLQTLFWSHYDEELPSYRSTECRNGGAYDLHKDSSIFP